MIKEINYQDVSDFEKVYGMAFKKRCYVTNLQNGITKPYNTKDILDQLEDTENILYNTNYSCRREYAAINIYILENNEPTYWSRIKLARVW